MISIARFGSMSAVGGRFPLCGTLSRVFASLGHRAGTIGLKAILGSATDIHVHVGRPVVGIEVTRRTVVVVGVATENQVPTGRPGLGSSSVVPVRGPGPYARFAGLYRDAGRFLVIDKFIEWIPNTRPRPPVRRSIAFIQTKTSKAYEKCWRKRQHFHLV